MSVVYGGEQGAYGPPRKVNFGWIGESFNLFQANAGTWIVAILVYGVLNGIITAVFKAIFHNPNYYPPPNPFGNQYFYNFGVTYGTNSQLTPLGQIIHLLFSWAYGAFQSASLYRVAVKQVRGESVSLGDAFGGGPYWGNMLVFNLIAYVAAIAGMLALCVGLFVVAGFLLPGQALVADGRSATQALSESIDGMKNDWLSAALFFFVFVLLLLVSLIPCGLGLFVTIPMLHIVGALAYRDMVGIPGLAAHAGPSYGVPQPGVWPPPPTVGQAPPVWGQTPTQTPPPGQMPPGEPPRTTLGGDPLDNNTPPGTP